MTHYLQNKTSEERKAITAKGVATRQKNKREREAQRLLDIERRDSLKCEIKELELKTWGFWNGMS
jgi:hypothetical protein